MLTEHIYLLLLIIVANGAPIVMRNLLGNRLSGPVDFGFSFVDGRPIFGKSKTWRGVASALVFTSVAGAVLGYTLIIGLLVAVYTVIGDLFSSFVKRRLGMAPSSMAPLIDQVPEAFLPAVMLRHSFDLDAVSVMILVCVFVVVELALSYVLFKLGIRNRPY